MDDCPPTLDALFGPSVAPCRRPFDFTLLFEETILTVTPTVLFIILCFPRLYVLLQRQSLIQPGRYLYIGKLAAIFIYVALQAISLVLTCTHPHTRTSIPATTLTLLSSLLIPVLSHLEHTRSTRPSALLCVYLLLTLPFDGTRTRTLWLSFSSSSPTMPTILATSLGVKVFLLTLECARKPLPHTTELSPESTAGILSQTFLLWILPLLHTGYKRTLQLSDLYPIPRTLCSSFLSIHFRNHWTLESSSKHALLITTALSLPRHLLAPIIPRLALIGFTFAQPFLVSRVLSYLAEGGEEGNREAVGYSLMAAYGIVYTGIAASNTFYNHLTYRLLTAVRGGLIGMIYEHTLTLPSVSVGAPSGTTEEKKQENAASSTSGPSSEPPATSSSSAGEEKGKNAPLPSPPPSTPDADSAVTLMSTDVERIVSGLKYLHEPWANTIECILAVYLLSRQVGVSGLAMVALALLCVLATTRVAGVAGVRQGVWMAAIQKRVGATAGVLGAVKGVKMMGLESRVGGVLQRLREVEVEGAGLFRQSIVWSIGLSYATLIFSPLLVFAAFTGIAERKGQTLDVGRMFTSLTLISLLAAPLVHLFQALPALSAAGSCAGRIQAFLRVRGRVDVRGMGGRDGRVHPWTPDSEEGGARLEKKVEGGGEIVVRGGSFGFSPDAPPVVKGVDLHIRRTELVMLLGPVGCGKSTLLKALLGEVAVLAGTVNVSGGVAYCDQTAWLVNDSVRANVIGPAEYDEGWYRSVMRACVLDGDVDRLVDGDGTRVGSRGVGLSGGQKQRLALARALYARREIIILDDIFSGLDRTTVELLFERLWGADGLLRRIRATTVFATHSMGHLRYADRVVALGADGKIVEQGTTAEVLAAGEYVKSLCSAKQSVDIVEDEPVEKKTEVLPNKPTGDGEGREGQTRDRDVYRYYFRAIGKLNTVGFVAGGICFAVLLKFPDQWLTWWSNANTTHPNQRIGYYLGVYAAFNVLAFISLCAWSWHLFHGVVATSGKNLHRELLKTVMSAPFPYISRIDTGVTTNRFSQDMLLIDGTLPLSLLNTAAELFTFIMQIGLIAAASPFILAAFPFIFAVVYIIQRFYLCTSKQLRLMDLEAKSPLYAHFIETSSGLALIRAYGWQRFFTETTSHVLDESQKPFYLLYCVQVWLNLVLDLVVAGLAVVIIGIAVGRQGLLSTSAVGLALVNITTLGETLKNLVISYTSLETSMGAISRLETFTRETPNEDAGDENYEPPNWPSSGAVELKDISAAYREDGAPVLKNISLKIEAGQKVAVCGRSGSGKTSLLTAFCRMLDLTSGAIYIDGIDLSTIHRHYVRSHLNVVPQDAYAFPGSIRANLDLAGGTPDEELVRILTRVKLWEKIKELGGLDAEMNLEGLSAGQRQLVCLARAMIKRSDGRILLLDEATSSVDVATEKLMQRIVEEEFKDHTVIAVLHRLGSALEYEKIAVLDKGVLVDFGTPEKLVESSPLFKGFKG